MQGLLRGCPVQLTCRIRMDVNWVPPQMLRPNAGIVPRPRGIPSQPVAQRLDQWQLAIPIFLRCGVSAVGISLDQACISLQGRGRSPNHLRCTARPVFSKQMPQQLLSESARVGFLGECRMCWHWDQTDQDDRTKRYARIFKCTSSHNRV